MGGFQHIAVEVIVGKDGAAHGAYADGLIQKIQLHQRFGYQLVDDAVVAAGAVVDFRIRETLGFLIDDRHIT